MEVIFESNETIDSSMDGKSGSSVEVVVESGDEVGSVDDSVNEERLEDVEDEIEIEACDVSDPVPR